MAWLTAACVGARWAAVSLKCALSCCHVVSALKFLLEKNAGLGQACGVSAGASMLPRRRYPAVRARRAIAAAEGRQGCVEHGCKPGEPGVPTS